MPTRFEALPIVSHLVGVKSLETEQLAQRVSKLVNAVRWCAPPTPESWHIASIEGFLTFRVQFGILDHSVTPRTISVEYLKRILDSFSFRSPSGLHEY